jgi:hypothetical protein
MTLSTVTLHKDVKLNESQQNDTQHFDIHQNDKQQNDEQQNETYYNSFLQNFVILATFSKMTLNIAINSIKM